MTLRIRAVVSAAAVTALFATLIACNCLKDHGGRPAPTVDLHGPATQAVGRVNGSAITRGAVRHMVQTLLEQKQLPPTPSDEVLRQIYREALEQLVSRELLYQVAQRRGSAGLEQQVALAIAHHRARHRDEDRIEKGLEETGLSLPELQDLIRKDLVVNNFIDERFGSKATVSEAEAAGFYEDNKGKFKSGSSVRASQILIRVSAAGDRGERERALDKAKRLLERVRNHEDFGALASRHSQCSSRVRGGDLGFVSRGKTEPALERALFSLKVGGLGDLVETPYGFHIVKLTAKRGPGLARYDEVQDKVQEYLKRKKLQKMLAEYVDDLRGRAKIESL